MRSVFAAICMFHWLGMTIPFASAADPQPAFWSGRLADKTQTASTGKPVVEKSADSSAETKPATEKKNDRPPLSREPEWLRKMDKNDRTTLTGGWGLQNLSGGKSSLTTAGDRRGHYAPNTYQGRQFQQWNNVSPRQSVASWNGTTANYPAKMWSHGYTSPNSYVGAGAQRWGNMSAGGMSPNTASGGWSMAPWR